MEKGSLVFIRSREEWGLVTEVDKQNPRVKTQKTLMYFSAEDLIVFINYCPEYKTCLPNDVVSTNIPLILTKMASLILK